MHKSIGLVLLVVTALSAPTGLVAHYLRWFATTVPIFFIAGLPYLVCFGASITYEPTASRPDTGLLIPIC
jgi:hypothetical protein